MRIASVILIALYAALNVFLVPASFTLNPEVGLGRRLPALIAFGAAALCLGIGAWRRNTVLVMVGLVIGSVGPVLFGHFVERHNVLLHHAVRAVIAGGMAALWFAAFHRRQSLHRRQSGA